MEHLAGGELLDAVRGLYWPARRVTRGVRHGGHRSRRVGASPEFMQFREYRPGDELSKVDWKLYGRTDRVAVRETHDDSDLRTTIVVDASASMDFPAPSSDKWMLAAAVAYGLTAVAVAGRDPVGLAVVAGDGVRLLPPRARTSTTVDVLRVLDGVVPAGSRPVAPVIPLLRGSHRLAIITDFLGDADPIVDRAAEWVAAGREVFAVHVVAREELEPDGIGGLVVDPEDESVRRPFDDVGVAAYRRAFADWREELAARLHAAGAVYRLAVTDEPAKRIIRQVVTPSATAAATHAPS